MTSPPRVLILASFPESLTTFRGDFIQTLLAAGMSVHAAAPGLSPQSAVGKKLAAWGAHPHAVALARTSLNPASDVGTAFALYRLCRRIAPSHLLAYTAKPVVYGVPAARLAGVARTTALITGLGYAFTGGRRYSKRWLVRGLLSGLYRSALRAADRVVFQNPDDRQLFIELRLVDEQRSGLVDGSGINLGTFPVEPLPPCAPTLHFLTIARLLRDKGIYELADAARRLRQRYPNVQFHLVGGHDTNPTAIRRADLDAWITEGIISYHGQLGDVRPVLARSHVYVLPSYREGTPRTVLEAMATGRAIITTDVPGCRETVAEGRNGYLVPARSADALVDAMERIILDPEQLTRLGKASRELAERKYDVVRVNRQLMLHMGLDAPPR